MMVVTSCLRLNVSQLVAGAGWSVGIDTRDRPRNAGRDIGRAPSFDRTFRSEFIEIPATQL